MLLTPAPAHLKIAGVKQHQVKMVESDVFNICQRIKDIDRSLYIVLHEDHERPWVVMEDCADGDQRMVSRYERLDASILDDLRYMLSVPFEKRFAELTKRIDKENEDAEKFDAESEWFEEFAWNFQRALVDANMVDPIWHRSYRPVRQVARAH